MAATTGIGVRLHALGSLRAAARDRARVLARWLVARIRARTPEQVLWVVLGLVMLAYLVVLWTASTATGRGGR